MRRSCMPLTWIDLFFSWRHCTRGFGLPDVLQDKVAFSPSWTDTSPAEVPLVIISGGTEDKKTRERIIKYAVKNEYPCNNNRKNSRFVNNFFPGFWKSLNTLGKTMCTENKIIVGYGFTNLAWLCLLPILHRWQYSCRIIKQCTFCLNLKIPYYISYCST